MFEPKATAPHLDSTKTGKAQGEQMFSALLPTSDIARSAVYRRLRHRAAMLVAIHESERRWKRAKWLQRKGRGP
jgi:hypothetical protein